VWSEQWEVSGSAASAVIKQWNLGRDGYNVSSAPGTRRDPKSHSKPLL